MKIISNEVSKNIETTTKHHCHMCGCMTDHQTSDCPHLKCDRPKMDGKHWCAMCGKYGDHQSGTCPEMKLTETIVDSTIAERGKVYGDPHLSHTNIGLSWTGLLQQHYGITLNHPIPASLVAQMMVTFKMQRSARVFKDDNYTDARAYTKFAEDFQREEKP